MTLCPNCGDVVIDGVYHNHPWDDHDWARVNAIMCDAIHRGIHSTRLSEVDRRDDWIEASDD